VIAGEMSVAVVADACGISDVGVLTTLGYATQVLNDDETRPYS
jgi:hypothetical protein